MGDFFTQAMRYFAQPYPNNRMKRSNFVAHGQIGVPPTQDGAVSPGAFPKDHE